MEAGTAGAATAVYANNRPTIRINILTVRFIGSPLYSRGSLGAKTLTESRIIQNFSN